LGIRFGANVFMPNITPEKYRDAYALYQGKAVCREAGSPLEYLRGLFQEIEEEIVLNQWGDSPHFKNRE